MAAALLFVWAAGCASAAPDAEQTASTSSPIEDGTVDTTHAFVVGLVKSAGGGAVDVCSGVLLAPNLVATARHCVADVSLDQIDCPTSTFGPVVPASHVFVSTGSTLTMAGDRVQVSTIITPTAPEQAKVCGNDIALVILDLGLPSVDGLEVCRRIGAGGRDVPVLMLTARTDEVDFVVGLDAGADDYVSKPYRLAELLARVRALLRRRAPEVIDIGGVRMETAARRVLVDGTEISLANKEFELLRVLMAHAGQVVTREEILAEVWNDPGMKTSKTLDMHMSWLRRKLAGPDSRDLERRIATVRGVGFRFDAN